MTMYPFSKGQYAKFAKKMESAVPITWRQDDSMSANAGMRFEPASHPVVIEYKTTADEIIDVVHELVHVEMFFVRGFRQLAWGNPPPAQAMQRLVYHIRNIVDDTYVFSVLADQFDTFPLSPVFFEECKKDKKRKVIGLAQSEPGADCQAAVAAWRIRMAELATSDYADRMKASQKKIASQFLAAFKSTPSGVADLLKVIRRSVKTSDVSDVEGHSRAIIALRDHFGIAGSTLHLAAFRKESGGHVLKRV